MATIFATNLEVPHFEVSGQKKSILLIFHMVNIVMVP
jgi:hypothetical protein